MTLKADDLGLNRQNPDLFSTVLSILWLYRNQKLFVSVRISKKSTGMIKIKNKIKNNLI